MYAVIFVRIQQGLSKIFRMLTDCNTHPETTPTSILITIKYSRYYVIFFSKAYL